MAANPLIPDREAEFLLYELADAGSLCLLPAFREHSRDTFDLYVESCRRLARQELFPAYKPMDETPPVFADGAITLHPLMRELYPKLVELGVVSATRPAEVGGAQLPLTVATIANLYLMAANAGAVGYPLLTSSAAHLIESFGDATLRSLFMDRMYTGEWTGTMALTEPQAGSSLADLRTSAVPTDADHYLIQGSKIFISGGDHDLTENVVNLTLARIEGAPPGIRGISLFAVPKRRLEGGRLVDNDLATTQAIHKLGWKAIPSLVLSYGERGDCRGWLVGDPHRGLSYMFQMMNAARLMIGGNGTATAAVAYQEALAYARERAQGRAAVARDPARPQVPIIEHADVRRMLLRQKAIVEGASALLVGMAHCADLSLHATAESERDRASLLLDTLVPVVKSFPAEFGFEANVLSMQVHGGYGYSSEYLPEAWLRDQKLNSIHEGTTGIQSIDLLGRKALARDGEGLRVLAEEIASTVDRAREAGVDPTWCDALLREVARVDALTEKLAAVGHGDPEQMLVHSADYLTLFSILAISWQWLEIAAAAKRGLAGGVAADTDFYRGKLQAAQYWIRTELPRVAPLAELCESGEDSYACMRPDWF